MDPLDDAGEALGAALAAHSPHRPDPALRDRVLQDVRRRGRPHSAAFRWRLRAITGATALVLLLAASLAWGISLERALAQERTLRAQLEDATGKDEVVFEVVDARNVAKTTLRSTSDDSPTAPYAKVFVRPDLPYVVAMAGRLPPPGAGREYHLYLNGQRFGTIVPNESGFGYLVSRTDAVGVSYTLARVILEEPASSDAGGVVVLTGAPK